MCQEVKSSKVKSVKGGRGWCYEGNLLGKVDGEIPGLAWKRAGGGGPWELVCWTRLAVVVNQIGADAVEEVAWRLREVVEWSVDEGVGGEVGKKIRGERGERWGIRVIFGAVKAQGECDAGEVASGLGFGLLGCKRREAGRIVREENQGRYAGCEEVALTCCLRTKIVEGTTALGICWQ